MVRRRKQPAPVERTKGGGFVINLRVEERDLLIRLLGELQALLIGPADDPMLRRMFPPAYHLAEHAAYDEEYQRLMREELVASRLTAISTVSASLAGDERLDEEGLLAFMQSLNGLRLVLGTLLDVDESHDLGDIADDDPMVGEHHLYGYLSYVLDAAVQAMF